MTNGFLLITAILIWTMDDSIMEKSTKDLILTLLLIWMVGNDIKKRQKGKEAAKKNAEEPKDLETTDSTEESE